MKLNAVFKMVGLTGLMALPVHGHSACPKEDVEFYLDKGFTQEQITLLCAAEQPGSSAPDYQPYQQKVIIYQQGGEEPGMDKDGFNSEERAAITALEEGGDVIRLKVTPEHIRYTREVCLISGGGPEYSQRYRTCPEVDFSIQRKGLKVASSGKRLLIIGNPEITLEGSIERKLKGNWDDYSITVRKELKRNFNWKEDGHKTDFPVRDEYSVTRLITALRTLSTVDDEPLFEGAQEESEEAEKSLAESGTTKNKKKRWWNPLD